jgi:hypothetical protein
MTLNSIELPAAAAFSVAAGMLQSLDRRNRLDLV